MCMTLPSAAGLSSSADAGLSLAHLFDWAAPPAARQPPSPAVPVLQVGGGMPPRGELGGRRQPPLWCGPQCLPDDAAGHWDPPRRPPPRSVLICSSPSPLTSAPSLDDHPKATDSILDRPVSLWVPRLPRSMSTTQDFTPHCKAVASFQQHSCHSCPRFLPSPPEFP